MRPHPLPAVLLALILTVACSSTKPLAPPAPTNQAPVRADGGVPVTDDDLTHTTSPPMDDDLEPNYSETIEFFDADVRIDEKPGSKRFQGVWLEPDEGDRLLVAYRARPEWTKYEGQRVHVSGRRYQPSPMTQHILAQHFAVESVRPALEPDMAPRFTGPPTTVEGVVRASGGMGKSRVLVTLDLDGGGSRVLSYGRTQTWERLDGERVRLEGRPYEPGHEQRVGGEHLWPMSLEVVEGR